MKVEIYSKTTCAYCTQAKLFLTRHGIPYEEIVLDDDDMRQAFYDRVGENVHSVPQIFLDGERLGGYQELLRSDIIHRHQAGIFTEQF